MCLETENVHSLLIFSFRILYTSRRENMNTFLIKGWYSICLQNSSYSQVETLQDLKIPPLESHAKMLTVTLYRKSCAKLISWSNTSLNCSMGLRSGEFGDQNSTVKISCSRNHSHTSC